MTPLHILIGLHYHCFDDGLDYGHGTPHGSSPAVLEYCADMAKAGMLQENFGAVKRKYEPTDGLRVWVEALTEVPFPKLEWVKQ